jgi:molecular chaperone GrpE
MMDSNNINDQGRNDMDDLNTDENIAGATRLDDIGGREEEIERLKDEVQEQKDKYLRLFAEFDNFRKRSARENLELRQTAGKEVIVSLLDVLDDCNNSRPRRTSTRSGKAYNWCFPNSALSCKQKASKPCKA